MHICFTDLKIYFGLLLIIDGIFLKIKIFLSWFTHFMVYPLELLVYLDVPFVFDRLQEIFCSTVRKSILGAERRN